MYTSGGIVGPGGQQFFDDPEGRPWVAYHAWTSPTATYRDGGMRLLRVEPLSFANGAPVWAASP
jgi:hypothetical protein